MSLEKSIKHGKEKRKPYYKSERFDRTCRPNGGCAYCRNNRKHKHKKRECACKAQIHDLYYMDDVDKQIREYWENDYNYEYIEDGSEKERFD